MKKLIFHLALLLLPLLLVKAQIIPYSNTTRIFDLDSGNVMKFFKIPLSQQGYKNLYIQRGGIGTYPYDIDMRHGNILRLWFSTDTFSDSAHNRRLHNSWSFYYGYNIGYVEDFCFSVTDTSQFIYTYWPPDWEPYASAQFTLNDGASILSIFPMTFMAQCGGVAVDPVNDSIMYCTFSTWQAEGNIHRTTNKGTNWIVVDTLSGGIMNCKLYVNKYSRRTLFLIKGSELYRSTLAGRNFQLIRSGLYNSKMFFSDYDSSIYLTSANSTGLQISTNNGTTWRMMFGKPSNDLEIDPLNSDILYLGCQDGIYRSTNRGLNWSLYNNSFSPSKDVKGIVKNPDKGDTLYVATFKSVYKVYGPFSVDTVTLNYFPLSVGNVYKYYHGSSLGNNYYFKMRIVKDTIISSKRYFVTSSTFPGYIGGLLRCDSITGNIYNRSTGGYCSYSPFEVLIDCLKENEGDTALVCTPFIDKHFCVDTGYTSIFGLTVKNKTFANFTSETSTTVTYGQNFGIISATYSDFWGLAGENLVGCYINGILYGDTTLTGINSVSSEIPDRYSLSQNYPNPFNPVTKIKFSIPARHPNGAVVSLKIFDILGREVMTLVNEPLQAGVYETTFDGSAFSSGIYFYRLSAENYKETKRMVLVK